MKKLFKFTFCLLFVFSLIASFSTLKLHADALEEDADIVITTNYNLQGLLSFTLLDEHDAQIGEPIYDNELKFLLYNENYGEDIAKIEIRVNNEILDEDYLELTGITKWIGSTDTEIDEDISEEGLYIVDIEPETEIDIEFYVRSINVSAAYKNQSNQAIGAIDNGIRFYTLDGGVKNYQDEVLYGQTLYLEIPNNITSGGGQSLYIYDSLYFFDHPYFQIENDNLEFNSVNSVYNVEFKIDKDFIVSGYAGMTGKKITFIAYYTQLYGFSLSFNDSNLAPVDGYNVIKTASSQQLGQNEFLVYGSGLEITMTLKDYTELAMSWNGIDYQIANLYSTDSVSYNPETGEVTINVVLDRNKNLVVYLDLITFDIDSGNTDKEKISFSKNTFKVGDEIEVSAVVSGSMDEIKDWTIAGVKVPNVGETDTANGLKRIDETTVIVDTAVWYHIKGTDFNNEIATGTKTSIIILIIALATAAIITVLAVILLMRKNANTKSKIKAILAEEKIESYKRDQSALFADLREDKAFTVSKDDVKARMKQKKQEKYKPIEQQMPDDDIYTPFTPLSSGVQDHPQQHGNEDEEK